MRLTYASVAQWRSSGLRNRGMQVRVLSGVLERMAVAAVGASRRGRGFRTAEYGYYGSRMPTPPGGASDLWMLLFLIVVFSIAGCVFYNAG